ncbi:anaerobic ribonucleoside-triphosphate reductase activating protein [bacterium]|nr:anaerobic ribonucleoside-triphosphate reductase activating protein [bacterium]NIN92074.1 anaerobic ribonucleoside-triphosphate reductase activating protein [bacterium]NIO18287.1 anaerobic ribonucleoside-triphosphate reductase activating protein [bacterium]NIO73261.1 anaerobic ribonucleoside-triphosphate reductase activating protein [bacterium]
MKILIKGLIETSLIDWDGKIVSTLYTPYCNFRCPYCQNAGLILSPDQYETIPFEVISNLLTSHQNWIDGICLTGGEPCFFEDLPEFLGKIRNLAMKIKLDTNGTFPEMLRRVIDRGLVDYVAMDIKAPLNFNAYERSTRIKSKELFEKVRESVNLIVHSGVDYEFRTTVVPGLHNDEDILEIAREIKGARKYALQNFSNRETMDPEFQKIAPYKIEELENMRKNSLQYVSCCVVRGK